MNKGEPARKSKKIDTNAIKARIKSLREERNLTQEEFYTFITGTTSQNGGAQVSKWENEKNDTLPSISSLADISKTTGKSVDWILFGDDEEQTKKEEAGRTLRDYCRILFVDIANKFHATWSLSDDSILHFAPQCKTAYIRYEIPLDMVAQINESTGYPSGVYYPSTQSRYMAKCASGMKELREAFSHTPVNKDTIDGAYNSVLKTVPDRTPKEMKENKDIPF